MTSTDGNYKNQWRRYKRNLRWKSTMRKNANVPHDPTSREQPCEDCGGSGRDMGDWCQTCGGRGVVEVPTDLRDWPTLPEADGWQPEGWDLTPDTQFNPEKDPDYRYERDAHCPRCMAQGLFVNDRSNEAYCPMCGMLPRAQ